MAKASRIAAKTQKALEETAGGVEGLQQQIAQQNERIAALEAAVSGLADLIESRLPAQPKESSGGKNK